jgi:hypothetical protein
MVYNETGLSKSPIFQTKVVSRADLEENLVHLTLIQQSETIARTQEHV